uniref:cytochrome P450 11B, mitochondrial-like n=1 Tax=Lonchura striata TaxID=40157 RepID=UPI000B4C221B
GSGVSRRSGGPRPFEEMPRAGRSRWLNLLSLWGRGGFQDFHRRMEGGFQRLGPVYRERVGSMDCVNPLTPNGPAWRSDRLALNRAVLALTRFWADFGLILGDFGNGPAWRSDRLALNRAVLAPAGARRFLPLLDSVARDFARALRSRVRAAPGGALTIDPHPLLFRFTLEADESIQRIYREFCRAGPGAADESIQRIYREFCRAGAADESIQRIYREFCRAGPGAADESIQRIYREFCRAGPGGVLAELLLQGHLPLPNIKANVTEFTAGGVDTTLCQVALYAMGRCPEVFAQPERYAPRRWLAKDATAFKALAFGFGARQCIGRRLAEAQMMLFLVHVSRGSRKTAPGPAGGGGDATGRGGSLSGVAVRKNDAGEVQGLG